MRSITHPNPRVNGKTQYNREYQRAVRASRRRCLNSAKLTIGCEQCGYAENADALQIDHIIPWNRQRYGVSRSRYPIASSWLEMWRRLFDQNTQVLCASCHAIKSVKENEELYAD